MLFPKSVAWKTRTLRSRSTLPTISAALLRARWASYRVCELCFTFCPYSTMDRLRYVLLRILQLCLRHLNPIYRFNVLYIHVYIVFDMYRLAITTHSLQQCISHSCVQHYQLERRRYPKVAYSIQVNRDSALGL